MRLTADQPKALAAIGVDLDAIFISRELSKSTWLVRSVSPGSEKMSRHSVVGGDIPGLLTCHADLRQKVQARGGKSYLMVVIQQAGLDGFWIDRVLHPEHLIESYVVHAASIAVSRRHRRAKTDRIDGETLIRTSALCHHIRYGCNLLQLTLVIGSRTAFMAIFQVLTWKDGYLPVLVCSVLQQTYMVT